MNATEAVLGLAPIEYAKIAGIGLDYFNTLKWPVLAGVLVSWFKTPLVGLIGRIRAAKVAAGPFSGEIEADAEQALDRVEEFQQSNAEHPPNSKKSADADTTQINAELTASAVVVSAKAKAFALSLTPDGVKNVRYAITYLRDLSESPPRSVFVLMSSSPTDFVSSLWKLLTGYVYRARAVRGAHSLWPGTPESLDSVYRELQGISLKGRATGDVTPQAAADFEKACHIWAGEYADFLEAALQAGGKSD